MLGTFFYLGREQLRGILQVYSFLIISPSLVSAVFSCKRTLFLCESKGRAFPSDSDPL